MTADEIGQLKEDVELWHAATLDREQMIAELDAEVERLKRRAGNLEKALWAALSTSGHSGPCDEETPCLSCRTRREAVAKLLEDKP